MRVVIVGAGMGGLTLAHALVRAGLDVAVYERDGEAAATGGYRLHLDADACAALRRRLEPELFQAVQASSAGPGAFRQFSVTDHRLRLLAAERQDLGRERLMIGRVQLRTLLCSGLEDRVHFGREFVRFQVRSDQTVEADFADGASTTADLLIGADGVGSRVASALAGRPTSARLGLSGIAGRTPVTAANRSLVPELLHRGPALALGPGGIGLFLTLQDPAAGAPVDPEVCRQVPALVEAPTLIWGVLATDPAYGQGMREMSAAELPEVAARMLGGWTPAVRELVRSADPASPAHYAFSAADPRADLTPWAAGSVTALGDAVHAMPPTGGRSAATAIRDADRLACRLAAVQTGDATLPTALADFHRDMASYAPAAVAESLVPVRWIRLLSRSGAVPLTRAALFILAGAARGSRAVGSILGRSSI